MKHLQIKHTWLQEWVRPKHRQHNPSDKKKKDNSADVLTTQVTHTAMQRTLSVINLTIISNLLRCHCAPACVPPGWVGEGPGGGGPGGSGPGVDGPGKKWRQNSTPADTQSCCSRGTDILLLASSSSLRRRADKPSPNPSARCDEHQSLDSARTSRFLSDVLVSRLTAARFTNQKLLGWENGQAENFCGPMTECFSVPETFASESSGWPGMPRTLPRRVRLSIEKAIKLHAPSSNQEVDPDQLDSRVAVVNEEHNLSREAQLEGVVRWLGRTCPDILFCEDTNILNSTTTAAWHRILYLGCRSAEVTRIPKGIREKERG